MSDSPEDSSLWTSPDKQSTDRPRTPKTPKTPKTPTTSRTPGLQDTEYDREAVLRRELEGVRKINASIEGVIETLERAKGNMGNVSGTVNNASVLLNTWTRILSQTEHNQRLILNPTWQGATQDVQDMEAEAAQKQQAAERKAAEEERKREAARRRREEEEEDRQRQATVGRTPSARGRSRGAGTVRGTRTRGLGHTRGAASMSGISGTSGSAGAGGSVSRIGRGAASSRGRYRGRGAGGTT